MKYRATIYLSDQMNVTTDLEYPEEFLDKITSAITNFHRRWRFRKTAVVQLHGNPLVIVPVSKIMCCKIEELRGSEGGGE